MKISLEIRKTAVCLCFLLWASLMAAQERKTHENVVSLNYLQVDEELNYGLVFRGPGLSYSFAAETENRKRLVNYSCNFGFTYLETRKIAAGNLQFVPFRLKYLCKPFSDTSFYIGPYLIGEYNYEVYPDLQSGFSYWLTHVSVGINFKYQTRYMNNLVTFSLSSTLAGMVSRTAPYKNPYFYDLSFGDVIRYVNSDFTLETVNRFNQSGIEIRWQPGLAFRLAFAYVFEYYGYYDYPRMTMINQMAKVIILPKPKT